MDSTSRPSVFSRLSFEGQQHQGSRGVEGERRRGEEEVERKRRRRRRNDDRDGPRRSDERMSREFESGRWRGGRESPRKRDLGISRRGSPIKKVNLKESPIKRAGGGRGFQDQDLRERVRKTIGAGDGREQVQLVSGKCVERETDEEVLARREKQISYGKNTVSYDTYLRLVEKSKRETTMPRTPDKRKKYSRRAWDGLVKSWKQKIHKFAESVNNEDGDLEEVDAEEDFEKEEDFDKVMDDIEALVGNADDQTEKDFDSQQNNPYIDWADEVEDTFGNRQRRASNNSDQGLYSGEDTPSKISGSSTGTSTPRQLDLADSKDRFMQNHIFCWDLISKHPKYWNAVFTEKEPDEDQDDKDYVDI